MINWNSRSEILDDQSKLLASPKTFTNTQDTDLPPTITDWISAVKLLKGIPFRYLVPNPSMLPKESIRFFQLDWNWIEALIDGSLSIGRSTTGALSHDQAQTNKIKALTSLNLPQVSGFLLRSGVVSGWPGMKVVPSGTTTVIRAEHVAPNIFLCLFKGLIDDFYLHEPEEGLHFGVDISMKPKLNFSKSLKYVKDIAGQQAGDAIENCVIATIPMRSGGNNVIDIQDLSNQIHQALITSGALLQTDSFTSAEFGLEMIEGVQRVQFTQKEQ